MVRNFRGSYTDVSKNILVYNLTVTPTNLMTLRVKLKKFFDVEDDLIQKNLRNSPATPKKNHHRKGTAMASSVQVYIHECQQITAYISSIHLKKIFYRQNPFNFLASSTYLG